MRDYDGGWNSSGQGKAGAGSGSGSGNGNGNGAGNSPFGAGYRAFDSFCGRPTRGALSAMLSFAPMSPRTREHVAQVYWTLLLMAGTTTAAVLAQSASLLPAVLSDGGILPGLAAIACLIALSAIPANAANAVRRLMLALLFALLKGLSIAPLLVSLSVLSAPSVVPSAAIATIIVFASFSIAAMRAERRTMMYLGGWLGSAIIGIAFLSFANIFLGSAIVYSVEIYLGLLVFAGYVMYDTQLMIQNAEDNPGAGDSVGSAVNLYVNAVAIFIRLAILFARAASRSQQRKQSGYSSYDNDDGNGDSEGEDEFGSRRRASRRARASRGGNEFW